MSGSTFIGMLFNKHKAGLLRYIGHKFGSDQAEDIVQDAIHNMIRAGEKIETLESPQAYLYRSAYNLGLDRIRKQIRHQAYVQEVGMRNEGMQEEEGGSLEKSVVAQQDIALIQDALDKLPPNCRQAFLLSRLEGQTHKEISQRLGVSVSTIEKYIMRTMKYLSEKFEVSQWE